MYESTYKVTQRLQHIYTSNHATFQIRTRKITVQICVNFWVTQYIIIRSSLDRIRLVEQAPLTDCLVRFVHNSTISIHVTTPTAVNLVNELCLLNI